MRITRFWLVLAALAGCSTPSDPVASAVLVGEFGGTHSLLHATATGATLDVSCGLVTFPGPLRTDARGMFSVDALRKRIGGAVSLTIEPPTPVRVDGLATGAAGGTVRLILTTPAGAGPSWSDTLALVRDRAATIFYCP
jgi:hypothetical protein